MGPLIPQSLTSDLAIDINEAATITVALLLCYNGWKLVKTLGGILLCSFLIQITIIMYSNQELLIKYYLKDFQANL